jgi:hypothetical protein
VWALLVLGGQTPSTSNVRVWGADGHSIVCEIAFLEMNENTRTKVRALISTDSSFGRFSESCSWADLVRSQARDRAPHFQRFTRLDDAHSIDFSRGAGRLDRHACTRVLEDRRSPCVVDAISESAGVLASEGPAGPRLEALKFLSHFVGDLHQPLQAGYADGLGDNSVVVLVPGGVRRNLHSVWDSELIAMARKPWQVYAAELHADITPIDRVRWSDLDPFTWASESFALVEDRLHNALRVNEAGEPVADRDFYLQKGLTLERRLKQAGFRLARVLEQVLGTHP